MRIYHRTNPNYRSVNVGVGRRGDRQAVRAATSRQIRTVNEGTAGITLIIPDLIANADYRYVGYTEPAGSDQQAVRLPSQRKPLTASEWVDQNSARLKRHAGKWVAITHTGLKAVSDDFDDVFQRAREKGIENPLVFKVPKSNSKPKIVSVKIQ